MVKKKVITIVNVDSLLGYSIAFRFLESKRKDIVVQLLCHKEEGLTRLEDLGGKVIKVHYKDDKKIDTALDGNWLLLIIPEHSEKRLEYGDFVLCRAKALKVNYVVLFSFIGVENLTPDESRKDFKNLAQYQALEDKLRYLFHKDYHCIIRIGFLNQLFYYLGPMFEDKNQMRLSVNEESKWSSTDLADIVDAVYSLSFTDIYSDSSEKNKNKTLFIFTPKDTLTARDVVSAANEGLNKNMTYDMVKQKELTIYLQEIHNDNRFRTRPFEQLESLKKDRPYTFPLGKYLTNTYIDTLLEWWLLSDDRFTDVTSDDLRRALGCPPHTIKQFFKQNSDQFRLLR
ncbi:hypothetical protein K501DRAFT_250920 [Backusella circina FSU 941]|nr:hypothetical protein K501DRAFT_250920 [Backusella circina FSU 941]